MMDDILAGVGGALEGGLKGFTWSKEFQQKDREINNRKEVALLQQEIRQMLASMSDTRARDIAGANNTSRETVAGVNNASRETIAGANNASRETIATGRNATTERGQDITQQLGILRNDTTRRGQDFGFTLGTDRNETTRRGQDIGATTTRHGQDITEQLGISAEGGRATRATDANALREQEIEQRERLAKKNRANPFGGVDFTGGAPPPEVKEGVGTGKPTAQPIEVKETTGGLPVAPRSPEAAGDQSQRLEQQALSVIQKYQTEKDPAKKTALRNDLARIREQILKAQQKPGGQ